jgi:hypothetical protein
MAFLFLVLEMPSFRKGIASLLLPQPSGPLALLLLSESKYIRNLESCSTKQTKDFQVG